MFTKVFNKEFISRIFKKAEINKSFDFPLVWHQKDEYIAKVDLIIAYLRCQEATSAYQILHKGFLLRAHRFLNIRKEDIECAFGNLGVLDKA